MSPIAVCGPIPRTAVVKNPLTTETMEKEIQTHAKQTDIPEDMWEAVGALREALFDNPCVILDAEVCEDEDRHYFFSDPDLYSAIEKVVENLPGPLFQGHSYVALAYALQKHGVICEAAITDSTDYDGGKTLRGICRAFEDLNSPANAEVRHGAKDADLD